MYIVYKNKYYDRFWHVGNELLRSLVEINNIFLPNKLSFVQYRTCIMFTQTRELAGIHRPLVQYCSFFIHNKMNALRSLSIVKKTQFQDQSKMIFYKLSHSQFWLNLECWNIWQFKQIGDYVERFKIHYIVPLFPFILSCNSLLFFRINYDYILFYH